MLHKSIYLNSEELGRVITISISVNKVGPVFLLDHVPLFVQTKRSLQRDPEYIRLLKENRTKDEAALIYALRASEVYHSFYRRLEGITFELLEDIVLMLFHHPDKLEDQSSFNLIVRRFTSEDIWDEKGEVLAEDSDNEFAEIISYNGRHFDVTNKWRYFMICLLQEISVV